MTFNPRVYSYVKELNGWTIQRITRGAGYRLAFYEDSMSKHPTITVEGEMNTLQEAEDRARQQSPCQCG